MRFALSVIVTLGLSAAVLPSANAADKRGAVLNANAIGLLASQSSSMAEAIAIASSVAHIEGLRVLPIVGASSLQSLNDLLFLKGIDAAIVSSDSLGYARKHGLYQDEAGKLAYLAKLANNSVIVLARQPAASLKDLQGKKVATGPAGSDSFVAADLVLEDNGVAIDRVSLAGAAALQALEDGSIEAAIMASSEAQQLLSSIPAGSGLRILPVGVSENLAEVYAPAIVDAGQYPNLLPPDGAVETVAAAIVVAVFDWPKKSSNAAKLRKFDKALFEQYLSALSDEKVTNFSAAVPGWKPFEQSKESYNAAPGAALRVSVVSRKYGDSP